MMITRKVLEELLQQPLGPYHDRDILNPTVCQMKGGTELVLYSFILEHDGSVTGLDESEKSLDGKDDRTFRFRGVLKIPNPEWLSDFGLKTVQAELNLRARERAVREGERQPPELTLHGLFRHRLLTLSKDATWRKEDETRLTVLIQGEKNMPASFMQTNHVPHGLSWSSKAHERRFQIATMDVETYSLSEKYFWQWRLWALMEKIVKQYEYVPAHKRTPMWFVERYLARFACPDEDKHRRVLFDEDDSDVDETGITVTPRYLLKPHTSEILGLFAAHVEWLITYNEMKGKLFDIASWKGFAKRVKKERREARRHGVRWGLREGEEADDESSEENEESNAELAERYAMENPVIGKTNEYVARKVERGLNREGHKAKTNVSSDSESDGDAPAEAHYLSDFSDPSDAEETYSDQQHAEEEAVSRIPWELQLPPQLPDIDGRWWCPLMGCGYQIYLHDIKEEEARGIPQVEYILQKQWRNAAYDEPVLQGFCRILGNHYVKHFKERGVKLELRDGKMRYTFIDGRPGHHGGGHEPIRGPMPARGTLGGESRVVPTVHARRTR